MKKLKTFLKSIIVLLKSVYWKRKILSLSDAEYIYDQGLKNNCAEKYTPFGDNFEIWQHQVCGIASLKMLTDSYGLTKNKNIYEMTQESFRFGTFIVPPVINKPSDIKGIYHKGLLKYAKSLGLEGFFENAVPIEKVLYYLAKRYFFLASVNIYKIWGKSSDWGHGRHIVLVVGFIKENSKITKILYKDSSTKYMWDKETDGVDFKKFRDNFNNRGIFLKI